MGRVIAPFGVRGWVKIQPFTESPDGLLRQPLWWLGHEENEDWQPLRLETGNVHGGQLVVAKLEGIDTPEQAAGLRHRVVAVPREALPAVAEGEFYWTDLIGLEVVNLAGESLGRVESLMDNGAQSVLVVAGAKQHLIPCVSRYVTGIHPDQGRIRVDWEADY